MYVAAAGTLTDHSAVPDTSADVVVSVAAVPTFTVTSTLDSGPVFPVIANPSAFSFMFTTPSPAIVSTVRTTDPAESTVTVAVALASFQLAVPSAAAVIVHVPTSTIASAPLVAFTVHTLDGAAA